MKENSSWRAQESTWEISATQWNKKKTSEELHKKGRKKSFTLPASFHSPGRHCPVLRRNSQTERLSFAREKSSVSNQLPQPFRDCMKDPIQFHPTQRMAKLRYVEMRKNKVQGQEIPVSVTSKSDNSSQWLAWQKTLATNPCSHAPACSDPESCHRLHCYTHARGETL